jgi:hypothetical protein
LAEAKETLRAIRAGEVDALVVSTGQGERIFTLKGADQTYRVLIEEMNEGAVTLNPEGVVLYCNRFAVVNVWDALRSDRPYRKAWPADKAHAYIREQAGKHFDPQVVEVFLRMRE